MDLNINLDLFLLPRKENFTIIKPVDDSQLHTNYGSEIVFEKTISYRNGLPWPVTIVEQSGMALTIPRIEHSYRSTNNFVVEVRYRFDTNVNVDIYRILDQVNDESSDELKAIAECYKSGKFTKHARSNTFVVAYEVDYTKLNLNSGPIFIEELNLTLCVRDVNEIRKVVHPNSDMGRYLKVKLQDIGCFNYGIEIVDPDNIFGEHYINIANRVFKIPVKRTRYKTPGVYVSISIDSEVLDFYRPNDSMISEYYQFDSAPAALGLFRTAKEAMELGDISKERKLELENRLYENKAKLTDSEFALKQDAHRREVQSAEVNLRLQELEAKLKADAIESKRELAEVERQLLREQAENTKMKMERERSLNELNHKHTIAQVERKDFSELLKWLPMALVALGAVIKAFR